MYQNKTVTSRCHQHNLRTAFWPKSQEDFCQRCLEKSSLYKNKAYQIQAACLRNTSQESKYSRKILLRKRKLTANRNILNQKQLSELFLDAKRSLFNTTFCKRVKTYRKPFTHRLSKLAIPKRIRIRENYGNYRNCLSPAQLDTLYNMMTDQIHKISFQCPNSMQVEAIDYLKNDHYKCRPAKSKLLTIQRDGDKIRVIEDTNKKSVKIMSKPTKCYPYDLKQIKHGTKPIYKDQETQTIEVKESKIVEEIKKQKQHKNRKPPKQNTPLIKEPTVDKTEPITEGFIKKQKSILSNLHKDFAETPCQLMKILRQCSCKTAGEIKIFGENEFPGFTLLTLMEKIEEILITNTKIDKVQQMIYDKIFDYIQTASPEAWNTDMDDFLIYISKEIANKISNGYKLPPEEVPCGILSRCHSAALQTVLSHNKNASNTSRSIRCENYNSVSKLRNLSNSQNKCITDQHSDNNVIVKDDCDNIQEIPPWMKSIVQCLMQALETLDIEVSKIYDENNKITVQTSDDEPKSIIHHCSCDKDASIIKLKGVNVEYGPCNCSTQSDYSHANESTTCSCVDWNTNDNGPKNKTTIRAGSDLQQKINHKFKNKKYPTYKFVKYCKEIWHSTSHQATSINTVLDQSNESDESISNNKCLQEKTFKKKSINNETSIPEDIFDERYLLTKKLTSENKKYDRMENCLDTCNDLIKLDDFSSTTVNVIQVENLIQLENTDFNNDIKQQSKIYNEMLQTKIIDYKSTLTSEFSFSEIITKKSNINKENTNRVETDSNDYEQSNDSNSIESFKELSFFTVHDSRESCDKSSSSSTTDEYSLNEKVINSQSNSDATISLPTKYTAQLLLHDMNNRKLRQNLSKTITNLNENAYDKCQKCKRKKEEKFNKKYNDISIKEKEKHEPVHKNIRLDDKNGNPSMIRHDSIRSNTSTASYINKQLNKTGFDEELKIIDEIQNAIEQIKIKGIGLVSNSNATRANINENDDVKSLDLTTNMLFERTDFIIKVINNEQMDKKYEIEFYPHGFEVVCLESLKSWLMFIREVTKHAMQWCCWINRNLKKILFTTSIIKGSAIDSNGNRVHYNCNICDDFVTNLHKDIKKWQTYNKNLRDSIKILLSCCQEKVLTNCNICTEYTINYQLLLTSDQLFYQLSEGLKTIELWRTWFNSTVLELSHGTLFIHENRYILHNILQCNCLPVDNQDNL